MAGNALQDADSADLATVAGRLRLVREYRGVKNPTGVAEYVKDRIGKEYSRQYPGTIERGKKPAGRKYLDDFASAFGVNRQWLEFGTGDPFAEETEHEDPAAVAFGQAMAGVARDLSEAQKLQLTTLAEQMAEETRKIRAERAAFSREVLEALENVEHFGPDAQQELLDTIARLSEREGRTDAGRQRRA